MHRVPLVLGLIALAAGIAMVGFAIVEFGIPTNEFGLGNTLIDAGTTAIVGGLVLLGFWATTAELRRLAREFRPTPAASTQLLPPLQKTSRRLCAERPVQEASEERSAKEQTGEELSSPAILKSGVISGMAYTLYADGSIEAELRGASVRFDSIDELRAHFANKPSA
jgi:hypothetical protein